MGTKKFVVKNYCVFERMLFPSLERFTVRTFGHKGMVFAFLTYYYDFILDSLNALDGDYFPLSILQFVAWTDLDTLKVLQPLFQLFLPLLLGEDQLFFALLRFVKSHGTSVKGIQKNASCRKQFGGVSKGPRQRTNPPGPHGLLS